MADPTVYASVCRFCGVSCPISVEMRDGRPVKVTGNKASPAYHGFCCTRGQALPEQMANPNRLLQSMKRDGHGVHVPIASQDMFGEVADRLTAILDSHGPDSIALYVGTYAVSYPAGMAMALAWIQALGSRSIFTSATIDQPGKDIANALLGSWEAGMHSFNDADVWMMIGANPLVSIGSGMPVQNTGHRLTERLNAGMKLIVIDPRRTQTADRAHLHIQPRPGEDAVILAGMIKVILDEGLEDGNFLASNVEGVNALRDAVAAFTPERVAQSAEIPAAQVVEAARMFAGGTRGLAAGGTGANMSGNSSLTEYLIQCLNTLCGRFLRDGDCVANPGVFLGRATPRAQPRPPRPAIFTESRLDVRGLSISAAGNPTATAADQILDGKVRALISVGGNPVAAWPDQKRTIAAIDALDLFITLDIKMSASAKLAHYVVAPKMALEVSTFSYCNEPYEAFTSFWGFAEPFGIYAPRLMNPPPGSDLTEEWEFFWEISRRMGLELTVHPPDAITSSTAREPRPSASVDMREKPTIDQLFEMMTRGSRISLDEVKRHPDGAVYPETIPAQARDPDCKARLDVGNEMMMEELRALATRPKDGQEHWPFHLISRRMAHVYNSTGQDLPRLIRKGGRTNPAFMHPEDLHSLQLETGDDVVIRSANGDIPAQVAADGTLRRGLVSMSHAWGGLPDERDQFRLIGSNTNQLTSVEDEYDRFSGIPKMSGVPVTVIPMGARKHGPRQSG